MFLDSSNTFVHELRKNRDLHRRLDDVLLALEYVIGIFDLLSKAMERALIEHWDVEIDRFATEFCGAHTTRT